jgi:chaperonin cofactor prefoldin
MSEENEVVKPGDMLRKTSDNISGLFMQIADHIEILETHIQTLQDRVTELESEIGNSTKA